MAHPRIELSGTIGEDSLEIGSHNELFDNRWAWHGVFDVVPDDGTARDRREGVSVDPATIRASALPNHSPNKSSA